MGTSAVTFDLDDTLVRLDRDRSIVLAEAARSVGAPELSRDAYLVAHREHHDHETREVLFAALLEAEGATGVDPAALARAYRERIGASLEPIPGAEGLLDRIAAWGKLALVTNGPARAQLDKLDRLDWGDRFDAVVISGRIGFAKPDPLPFEVACDRLGVDPSATVHVGDHPVDDIEGALGAGLDAIHVGDEPHNRVPTIDPDDLARALPEYLPQVRTA